MESLEDRSTGKTYLYEAMAAGVDIVRQMPDKDIVDRIFARIKEIPNAKVSIVGHTDTIGHEAYKLDLSTQRAKAAYGHILADGVPAGDYITYQGIGPHDALFDNDLPEGRAHNRTLTVPLEYEQTE